MRCTLTAQPSILSELLCILGAEGCVVDAKLKYFLANSLTRDLSSRMASAKALERSAKALERADGRWVTINYREGQW